ncbi:MAG: hypothetical protein KGJ23_07895 [Euryarchaeota archaeon]|nr:hypothetical protein [Euryarchaeota archaeon]MDE1836522.1 hypothetical protein [Euryarchaeota archaeon]MDE1879283.1 hypothetical protein [Euryarchaeota archaeon]MDE2044492.1 hypothetical protein [Thermoplasmata archaeon]
MNKIPTIFDRGEHFEVTPKVREGTEWVFQGEGVATEKLDGTNIRLTVSAGKVTSVEKRRNPTREEKAEGIEPGYVPAKREDPNDVHIFRAVDGTDTGDWPDGAWPCEAVGPKIQGNPLGLSKPVCYPFTLRPVVIPDVPRTFDGLREFLGNFDSRYSPGHPAEGLVFHHPDGRMAKLKKKDFSEGRQR